jgi:hypothetical protein
VYWWRSTGDYLADGAAQHGSEESTVQCNELPGPKHRIRMSVLFGWPNWLKPSNSAAAKLNTKKQSHSLLTANRTS